ncbi:extracellular solute-binding protein [Pseudomonas sp. ES3-33]|uniref:extracellular solute-binding protein n=1 Tax=Pseudomonas sp. ES3-33 TaxID=1628833 RepID=UPI0005D37DCC|nr:extracellular solute-binding protein [Pseudomonas sp. ES3-33]KJH76891.1 spermidine/putrescine ABC transporter substrate-binding protein [Pseudomonas sp. ES3-33]
MRALIGLFCLCLCFGAQATDTQLSIYTWTEYIPDEVLQRFKNETGIEVKLDVFSSAEEQDSKLLTGHSGYDVVFPSTNSLAVAIKAGAVQPIEHAQLTHYANLDPDLLLKLTSSDPGNQYGVPYAWGTVGLGINKQAVAKRIPDAPLNSLDLLFKPEYASKLKDCGIAVLDSPQEVISIVLNYLGHPPYSTDANELKQAQQLLTQLQPNLRYINSSRQIDDLAKGDVCLTLVYNGDAAIAAARASESKQPFEVIYRIPREGTLLWFDSMAIPVDAPHPQAARAFIDFMLRPESIAALTNSLFFANANKAATPLIDKAVTTDPDIYPSQEVRDRLFSEQLLPLRAQRDRTRLWTTFRTKI